MKRHRQGLLVGCCLAALTSLLSGNTRAEFKPVDANTVVDLTGTVSMSHQQWWPGGRPPSADHRALCQARTWPFRRRSPDRGREYGGTARLPAPHDAAAGKRIAECRLLGKPDLRQGPGLAIPRRSREGRWTLDP